MYQYDFNDSQIHVMYIQADVLLCSTSPSLDLSQGAVIRSLSESGGPSLQADVQSKYPNGIKEKDIAVIGAGNLSCKAVYLGTLPRYSTSKAYHAEEV